MTINTSLDQATATVLQVHTGHDAGHLRPQRRRRSGPRCAAVPAPASQQPQTGGGRPPWERRASGTWPCSASRASPLALAVF